MNFLTAEWRKLIMINYNIPPELISKYVPKGTEIDIWKGNCYISLVGFMFLNTKVLGIKVPLHVNFEEVNLRFYVKRVERNLIKRGVVFIKEIVPKSAITFLANSLYKENYETMEMKHRWDFSDDLFAKYSWKSKNNQEHFIQVNATNQLRELEVGSEAEFIAEHYWGYAKKNGLKSTEYEVTHPKWMKYDIKDFNFSVDFENLYGQNFSLLNTLEPASVFFVEGSEIAVKTYKTIS